MYAVEKQQLALHGSSDQWRWPPCCVPIWERVPLLEKVPDCHVLGIKHNGGRCVIKARKWEMENEQQRQMCTAGWQSKKDLKIVRSDSVCDCV